MIYFIDIFEGKLFFWYIKVDKKEGINIYMNNKPKTRTSTKKAIDKYRAEKDTFSVTMEKGTKDRIKTLTSQSINAYLTELITADLNRREEEKQYQISNSGISDQKDDFLKFENLKEKNSLPDTEELKPENIFFNYPID